MSATEEHERASDQQHLESGGDAVAETDRIGLPVVGPERQAPDAIDCPEGDDQCVADRAQDEQRRPPSKEQPDRPGELRDPADDEEQPEQRVFVEVHLRDREMDRCGPDRSERRGDDKNVVGAGTR